MAIRHNLRILEGKISIWYLNLEKYVQQNLGKVREVMQNTGTLNIAEII